MPLAKLRALGGWGHAISDEGSGYSIGLNAVKAALRVHDEWGDGPLLRSLMDALGAVDFDDFILKLNSEPQPDYAALFPLVQENAIVDEPAAVSVLEGAGLQLALRTGIVIRRLFDRLDDHSVESRGVKLEDISIANHGGVFENSNQVRKGLKFMLQRNFPHVTLLQKTC